MKRSEHEAPPAVALTLARAGHPHLERVITDEPPPVRARRPRPAAVVAEPPPRR